MNTKTIALTELPALTVNIKKAICIFAWSLYEINPERKNNEPTPKYILYSSIGKYLLLKDGSILRKIKDNEKYYLESQVYFEGFDLSNISIKIDVSNLKE